MQNPKPDTTPHRPPSRPAVFATASLALASLFASLPAPAAAQAFGGSILIADGSILVGEAAHLREPGTVRAYAFEDGRWAKVATLRGPGAAVGDGFGRSLARVDDFLFVGVGGDRVHLFRLADLGGAEAAPVQTLTLPGLAGFGDALATSGTDLMVLANADGEFVLAEFREGADGHWAHAGTLALGAEGTITTRWLTFGVGDNLVAFAIPGADRVHVFERGGRSEDWSSPAVLERPGPEGDAPATFGTALALHGGEILVGEVRTGGRGQGGGGRTGRVHRFARVDGDWTAVGTLVPGESASEVRGLFLAVHGNTLLVGAGGTMFAYARGDEDWKPTGAYPLAGDGEAPLSPQTVALGDGVAALGDPSADFGMGSVSVLSGESGEWMPAALLEADHDPLPAVTGGEVVCENGEAASYDCDHVDLLSFLPREELGAGRGARLNDIWGWTDPETGREYGLVGRMDGTAFVDVTDPHNPRYLGNLARTEGSRSSTWRDIKVFKDHAFIVADGAGAHGMQVFDLTGLRDVTEPREFAATALYTDIGSVHNRGHQRGDGLRLPGRLLQRRRNLRRRLAYRRHQRPPRPGLRRLLRPPQHWTAQYRQLARHAVRDLPRTGRGLPRPRDLRELERDSALRGGRHRQGQPRGRRLRRTTPMSPTPTRDGSPKTTATSTRTTSTTNSRAGWTPRAPSSGTWRIWTTRSSSASTSVPPGSPTTTYTCMATAFTCPTTGPACGCSTSAIPRIPSKSVTSTRLPGARTRPGSTERGASTPTSRAGRSCCRAGVRDCSW